MNIGIIGTRGIPNNYGGFEQFAEYLSTFLSNRGYQVTVYNSHNHPFNDKSWKGVNIEHCYDPEYLIGTAGQFFYDLNCIINSRRKNFDIILQLGYTSSSVWSRFFASKAILITNMDGLEWKRTKFNKYTQGFLKYAERLAIKYSDYFISDSIGIKQYLKEKYNMESRYIPYGTQAMRESDLDILSQYDLIKYKYDLLVARIEPENNIEIIIKGFLESANKRDLVIIGSMSTKFGQYIRKKYSHHRIKYLGFLSGLDKLNSLRFYSNLYFHGHSVGGTNPSLLEAMASESLICAHENIFNRSILQEEAFYFSTSKEVSVLMDMLIKEDHYKFIKRNIAKTKNIYTWDKICSEYEEFFKDIMSK